MDAVPPGVAERLTCSGSRVMWSALPSFTSRLVVDHWKLRVELDAVGRVEVDALNLAAQAPRARPGWP